MNTTTNQTWVDNLEKFLEGYGLPTAIATIIAIVVIIGIPTLVQIIRLMSSAKDNTAYRGIMLTRIASSTTYSKSVAEEAEEIAKTVKELCDSLASCKRLSDVQSVAKEYSTTIATEITEITSLVDTGTTMQEEYGSVPTKRALKEIEKAKKKAEKESE